MTLSYINNIALHQNGNSRNFIYFSGDGQIDRISLAELDRRAAVIAGKLCDLGIKRGDRIGVLASNSLEWVLVDLAAIKLGAVTAGFEAGRFQPQDIVARYGLALLFHDQCTSEAAKQIGPNHVKAWVRNEQENPCRYFHNAYARNDICAIKFTSGSTGYPKGLEATVGSVTDSISAVQALFEHNSQDNILIFLRLALLQQRYWIYSALYHGHDITISSPADVFCAAQSSRPTIVMGVPAFYEDVMSRLKSSAPQVSHDLEMRSAAIQSMLGGRIRYLWTGSAPASAGVLRFFNDCGVPLYEGYGLNETCIVSKNHPGAHRLGSVGKPLPNKAIRFDENGIIIVASRHPVNTQYAFCQEGESERMFLPTGEVKTWDIGYLDEDGFLFVQGRVDDIVTLSSGRNVLVTPLETLLKASQDVQGCVLFGNGKPFLTAIVSSNGTLSRARGEALLDEVNRGLQAEQKIAGLVVASEPFSVENGLLTSQYKPKRRAIFERYKNEIDRVYKNHAGLPG